MVTTVVSGVKSVKLKLPDENSYTNAITIKSILNAVRDEGKLGGKAN